MAQDIRLRQNRVRVWEDAEKPNIVFDAEARDLHFELGSIFAIAYNRQLHIRDFL